MFKVTVLRKNQNSVSKFIITDALTLEKEVFVSWFRNKASLKIITGSGKVYVISDIPDECCEKYLALALQHDYLDLSQPFNGYCYAIDHEYVA